ncbi:restriction endonuclease subunit S [Nesterenkonia massiliensis]|uniref:Restriction endonuclease subunit S n=1 Tax=Nesterenkonia massiliensis TaxID=1232429 RepID=A0ABT2HP25_9MICC|nr:restriction endonuclease subunit S [Nesterenkonia massiliensis]
MIASTIENLSSSKIGTFLIPSVDTSYQRAIADYLDHETAEIDAFIADLEDLQTRLMEEGEARIYAAVTGRFGDNSSFPTPGTDWTGPLPEGWATPRVSWVFGNIGSGTTPRSEDQQAFGDEVPWVTTGELREQRIDDTIRRLSRRALAEYPALEVFPPGSLLIAMYGATIGRLGWLGQPAAVNQAVCAMSGYKYGSYKYMFYVLRAARPYLLSRAVGGGQPNINQEIIRSLRVPMPTGAEQAEIVQQLEETMQHITEMSVLAAESVALAKERRAALISAAVTGQIDVTAKHKPAAEQLEDDIAQLD